MGPMGRLGQGSIEDRQLPLQQIFLVHDIVQRKSKMLYNLALISPQELLE